MNQQQCVSCNGSKSIYGHMCSDCRLLINGYIKETGESKSEEALQPPKRRKKKILSTLDILISVLVVTPLVVACWRGTWQLIDVYAEYFPAWESFLIGTTIHIILAISQESFHEILNKKHSSWLLKICVFLLMKLYTIVFNAVTNMYWRGSWIIIDEYFGITVTETGKTEVEDGRGALAFFTVCFFIMFCMKSLRNLNSPPFELCLDYGDDMFLFPNMFKVKFTLFAAVSTKQRINKMESENTNLSIIPEKVFGLKLIDMRKINPRPFQKKFHGRQPAVFTITSSTTEYPLYREKLSSITRRHKAYPSSIQEILNHKAPYAKINKNEYVNSSLSTNYLLTKSNYAENVSQGFKKSDSFQEYKPSHPGEINLLAMANVRFAPPIWQSYSSKYRKDTLTQRFLPHKEELLNSPKENFKKNKPICVTLNVMPVEQADKNFVSEKISLYILDVIFSVGVVNTLGIILWRGLWLIVDLYLFSDDQVLSAWASTFLGYVMVAIVFLLQPIMKKICDNLSGIPKLLVADAYIMFAVMDVIIVWRGIWNLLNIYFLPDYPELSCWLTHWIPMITLILMGCSNSVLVRGVCVDCEEPDGTCVVFPCNYLKVILDQEKNDSWFSIWSGMNKTKNKVNSALVENKLVAINYHIVKISGFQDEDSKNNNNIGEGIS